MRYLRKFENQTAYNQYLQGDDVWLPRVSLIVNYGDHPEVPDIHDDKGPSWVDFSRIGTEFIQIANGTMYFTDQIYNGISYKAFIEGDSLCIQTRNTYTNELTNDAYIDTENGQIVVNYPTGIMSYSIV